MAAVTHGSGQSKGPDRDNEPFELAIGKIEALRERVGDIDAKAPILELMKQVLGLLNGELTTRRADASPPNTALSFAFRALPNNSALYILPLCNHPGALAQLINQCITELNAGLLNEITRFDPKSAPERIAPFVLQRTQCLGELNLVKLQLSNDQVVTISQLALLYRYPKVAEKIDATLAQLEMSDDEESFWGFRKEAISRAQGRSS